MNNLQTTALSYEGNGNNNSSRQGLELLDIIPKVGHYYAVRCPDSEDYYLVVAILKMGLSQEPRLKVVSNPVYGLVPPQYEVLSAQQALKFMRLPDTRVLNAFPYKEVQVKHKKTYKEFSSDMELASHNIWLAEQKKQDKGNLMQRMSDAYRKKQRQKKIRKLSAINSHWKGLS